MSRIVRWAVLSEIPFFFDTLKVFHEIFTDVNFILSIILFQSLTLIDLTWTDLEPQRRGSVKQGCKALSIKIYLKTLFTHTYFAVVVSCSELKPTQTFTVMHEKFSPWSHMVLELRLIKNNRYSPGKWGYIDQVILNANKTAFQSLFCFFQAPTILSHIVPRPSALLS